MAGRKFYAYPTVKLDCSNTSNEATLAGEDADWINVYNAGPSPAFVVWGAGSQTASAVSFPIPPNDQQKFRWTPTDVKIAGWCLSGQTTTLYITPTDE